MMPIMKMVKRMMIEDDDEDDNDDGEDDNDDDAKVYCNDDADEVAYKHEYDEEDDQD